MEIETLNKFLFIIPLTPDSYLTEERKELRKWCFHSLFAQTYDHWEAIVIGETNDESIQHPKFIHINEEGQKPFKLQLATKYIRENNLDHQYIIRFDDDDIFNPFLLERIKHEDFDLYTDKYHHFIEYQSLCVSNMVRFWYPNTCIHRREHALAKFGKLVDDKIEQINPFVALIENNHAEVHDYYRDKKVLLAPQETPIYLRVLNRSSITSMSSAEYMEYLNGFGLWNIPIPEDFKNLVQRNETDPCGICDKSGLEKIRFKINRFRRSINYNKALFN